MIYRKEIIINTKGNDDIIDLTNYLYDFIEESRINDGLITIFVVGSTAGLTTIEYENGLLQDFKNIINELIPRNPAYKHHLAWHDDNGHSHLRASLIGSSISIPFSNKKLDLGTWQQVVLIDFDTHARKRKLIFQILY